MIHVLLAFTLSVILARKLGPAGYGVYSFAIAIIMLIAIPAQSGVPQLTVRETAKAQTRKDWNLLCGLWRWGDRFVISLSLVVIVIVMLLVYVSSLSQDERWKTVFFGLILIPLIALTNVRGAAIRGLKNVILGQLPEYVLRPLFLICGVVLGFYAFPEMMVDNPQNVMIIHAAAAGVSLVTTSCLLWLLRPAEIDTVDVPSFEREYWRRAILPLTLVAGFHFFNSNIDLIMLGVFRDSEEVGVYRVVTSVGLFVIFGLQAIVLVMQPHIAKLYAERDIVNLQKIVTISSRVVFVSAILPSVLFVVVGEDVLGLVFGEDYKQGSNALIFLVIAQLVNAGVGAVGMLLDMTGHERDTMHGVAIAAAINFFLNLLLIPMYGMEGAAIASGVSMISWNLMLRRKVKKRLGVESSVISR